MRPENFSNSYNVIDDLFEMFFSNSNVSKISIKRPHSSISDNELKEYSISLISLKTIKGEQNDASELSHSSVYQLKMDPSPLKGEDFGQTFWYQKLFEYLSLPSYRKKKIMPRLFIKKDTYEVLDEEAEAINIHYTLSYNFSIILTPAQYQKTCKAYSQEIKQRKIIVEKVLTESTDFYIAPPIANLIISYIETIYGLCPIARDKFQIVNKKDKVQSYIRPLLK